MLFPVDDKLLFLTDRNSRYKPAGSDRLQL